MHPRMISSSRSRDESGWLLALLRQYGVVPQGWVVRSAESSGTSYDSEDDLEATRAFVLRRAELAHERGAKEASEATASID